MTRLFIFFLCFVLATDNSYSQFEFLKKKVEEKVEEAIEGESKDEAPKEQEVEQAAEKQEQTAEPVKADLKSYSKYDFVPGDKTLFYEDFSQDAIGDFPQLWTTDGSGEVRTIDKFPGNWLYASSKESVYCLMQNLDLPDNFIFEFEVIPTVEDPENDSHSSFYLTFLNTNEDYLQTGLVPGTEGFHVTISDYGWNVDGYKDQSYSNRSESELAPIKINQVNHVIIWVQKRRLRIYKAGVKVIDGPTVLPQNAKYNRLRFSMWGQQGHPFFSNLKITTAAPDTRSKLITEGKLISYGIYFDIGKETVKPESNGALADIAKVLKENPEVKIKIIGHTDSDGKVEANLLLSQKRAEAVKNALVSVYGLDASKITTEGKGQAEPIEPNTTPQGKATNRRVEFVKM